MFSLQGVPGVGEAILTDEKLCNAAGCTICNRGKQNNSEQPEERCDERASRVFPRPGKSKVVSYAGPEDGSNGLQSDVRHDHDIQLTLLEASLMKKKSKVPR